MNVQLIDDHPVVREGPIRLLQELELRLGMTSAVGRGTTFTLELPAVERPA